MGAVAVVPDLLLTALQGLHQLCSLEQISSYPPPYPIGRDEQSNAVFIYLTSALQNSLRAEAYSGSDARFISNTVHA